MPRFANPLPVLALLMALALPGAASADPEQALLAADAARWTALAHTDLAALEPLLGEDLSYVHATGVVQTKPELLAALRSGALHYVDARPSERRARALGTAGIVTGRSAVTVELNGRPATVEIRYTATFAEREGRYLLAAYQSTLLPAAQVPAPPALQVKP